MDNPIRTEHSHNVEIFSQFGQSEWIFSLLCSMGITAGHIFEAGAHSPNSLSNSKVFLNNGFFCFLVEAIKDFHDEWLKLNNKNLLVLNEFLPYVPNALDILFSRIEIEKQFLVLFLDIDGGEYHLIEAMSEFRPMFVCVEVDNSFPINISFIPPVQRHGMQGGQASALAMFDLMRKKDYVYLRSFWQDMIFVDLASLDQLRVLLPGGSKYGLAAFLSDAHRHIYNPYNVIANQKEDAPTAGVDFYRSKLDVLTNSSHLKEASIFFNALLPVFNLASSSVIPRSENYRLMVKNSIDQLLLDYSMLLGFRLVS